MKVLHCRACGEDTIHRLLNETSAKTEWICPCEHHIATDYALASDIKWKRYDHYYCPECAVLVEISPEEPILCPTHNLDLKWKRSPASGWFQIYGEGNLKPEDIPIGCYLLFHEQDERPEVVDVTLHVFQFDGETISTKKLTKEGTLDLDHYCKMRGYWLFKVPDLPKEGK